MTEPQTNSNSNPKFFEPLQTQVLDIKISVDFEKCTGCGLCAEVCPFGLPQKDFTGKYTIKQDECTECSACKRNCPVQAIYLKEQKGCGCLWDTINRRKNGNDCSSDESCCG